MGLFLLNIFYTRSFKKIIIIRITSSNFNVFLKKTIGILFLRFLNVLPNFEYKR